MATARSERMLLHDANAVGVTVGQKIAAESLPFVFASDQPDLPIRLKDSAGLGVTLGLKAAAASLPVVLASDQAGLDMLLHDANGVDVTLGQKVSLSSLPVVLSSDQSAIPVLLNDAAGLDVNLGQQLAVASLPVILASDQPDLPILLKDANGVDVTLGQKAALSSLPVVLASDQSDLPILLKDSGGVGVTVGQKAAVASLPVVIASDQSDLSILLKDANGVDVTLGQKISVSSLPVVLSSDQSDLPILLHDANGVAITVGQKVTASSLPVTLASDHPIIDVQVGDGTNAANIQTAINYPFGILRTEYGMDMNGRSYGNWASIHDLQGGDGHWYAMTLNDRSDLYVDIGSIKNNRIDVNTGNSSAGTQRVVIASDQVALSVVGPLTDAELRATPIPISVAVLPLPTGAATLAEQQTQTAALEILDDWDEVNRAKVNPIVGQAGVAGNAGVIGANTQRVIQALDTGWLSVKKKYTAAQTNTIIVAGAAGETIHIKSIDIMADNANTVDVQATVGFHASVTPTGDAVIASHPGIAPGSGISKFLGSEGQASQTTADDLLITSEVPTDGSIEVTVIYRITS